MLASAAAHGYNISVWDILGALWIGSLILGCLGDQWRRARLRARQAAELRHQRRVELALAKSGQRYRRPGRLADDEFEVPAAVIALPPSAYPLRHVPGACRHEKIVPVITGDGEHVRWLCASPRCSAEFPPDIAIYETGT